MKLSGFLQGTPMEVLTSADNNIAAANLGGISAADDGSVFVLARVGALDIPAGVICQSPALIANHLTRTLTVAAAKYALTVFVPIGATPATAGQYAGGKLVVVDGTGAGTEVGISGHGASAGSAALQINLNNPLPVALDNTSVVSLIPNLYNGVIINPTTATGTVVGASPTVLTALTYVWLQIRGTAPILNDAGTAVGLGVAPSGAVAGAVKTMAATLPQVGRSIEAGVDTKKHSVYLNIYPLTDRLFGGGSYRGHKPPYN